MILEIDTERKEVLIDRIRILEELPNFVSKPFDAAVQLLRMVNARGVEGWTLDKVATDRDLMSRADLFNLTYEKKAE